MQSSLDFIMTSIIVGAVVSFVAYLYIFSRKQIEIETRKHVAVFFLIWILVHTLEYYIFGPYSYISMDSEGNLALAMNYVLTHNYDGGVFSHAFGGGQDMYIWFLGKQYFQPVVLLLNLLPIWLVILIHKTTIGALGFWGGYLLARDMANASRFIAVAVATLFPVSHLYLTDFSTSFGAGFAVLPLVIYTCTIGTRKKEFWALLLLTAVATTTTDPIKVFPAMAVAIIGGIIIHNNIDLKKTVLAFLAFVFLSVLNWHEIIYALSQGMSGATRGSGFIVEQNGLIESFIIMVDALRLYWLPTSLFIISSAVLFVFKDAFAKKSLLVLVWLLFALTAAKAFPWSTIGLTSIDRISHQYMVMAIGALCIPFIARALVQLASMTREGLYFRLMRQAPVAVLALGLAVLTFNKEMNFGKFIWFGGQSVYTGYKNLKSSRWKPNQYFRTVTVFDTPNPNIIAAFYGLDTFDGQFNLSSINWAQYWADIMKRNQQHGLGSRVGRDWQYWNGSTYDVEKHFRLDLLAIANVRFLISALPLQSDKLKLIFAPSKDERARERLNSFPGIKEFVLYRFKRIFDPGELFIYEIKNSLPRVFSASLIKFVERSLPFHRLHEITSQIAPKHGAVVFKTDKDALQPTGILSIENIAKVLDGYDVAVRTSHGGNLILNSYYTPHWKAWADGKPIKIISANSIQMAMGVPANTRHIKIRYQRPLLREKIAVFFKN
jgi:hypothetical protein